MKTLISALLGGAMVVGISSAAFADNVIAVQGLPNGFETNNGSWMLGFEFSPTVNLTVNELGSYFPTGVTSTHGVTLWTSSETELATTTLSGDGGAAGFQFIAITPVDLTAGQDYFVGGTATGDSYIATLSAPTVASQIDYIIHADWYLRRHADLPDEPIQFL
jgi:hypothetical protein